MSGVLYWTLPSGWARVGQPFSPAWKPGKPVWVFSSFWKAYKLCWASVIWLDYLSYWVRTCRDGGRARPVCDWFFLIAKATRKLDPIRVYPDHYFACDIHRVTRQYKC